MQFSKILLLASAAPLALAMPASSSSVDALTAPASGLIQRDVGNALLDTVLDSVLQKRQTASPPAPVAAPPAPSTSGKKGYFFGMTLSEFVKLIQPLVNDLLTTVIALGI